MDGNRARALLGVPPHATTEAVRHAFRQAVVVAHPDRGGDAATFRDLVAARDLLLAGAAPARRLPGRWAGHLRVPAAPTVDLVDVARRTPATAPRIHRPVSFDDVLADVLAA